MANLDDNLLISRQKVINYLGLNNNFDQKKLGLYVLNAQHEYLVNALGAPLYNKLISDNQANTSTDAGTSFTGAYETLVDNFVHPVLRWATYIEILLGSYLTVADNSIVQLNQSPSANAAQKADVEGKIELAEGKLKQALRRLKAHLDVSGSSTYPELAQSATLRIDDRTFEDINFGPGFWASGKNFTNTGIDPIDDYNNKRDY